MKIKKILDYIKEIVQWLLIVLFFTLMFLSFCGLFFVFRDLLVNYQFSLNKTGFENFIHSFEKESTLFTATLAITTILFAILRLRSSDDANILKEKQDKFNHWFICLNLNLASNPPSDFMKRWYIEHAWQLFDDLNNMNFNIDSKEKLKSFFDKHLDKELVLSFERQAMTKNPHSISIDNKTDISSCKSFETFRFSFFTGTTGYTERLDDLGDFYLKKIKE